MALIGWVVGQFPSLVGSTAPALSVAKGDRLGIGNEGEPLGREPLGPDLVAIPTVDPVSTRDIVALHRRSLNDSPALRAVLDALVVAAASKLG